MLKTDLPQMIITNLKWLKLNEILINTMIIQ